MELIANIGLGFSTALTPANLLYCLVGVFLGTLIGVLPGLGPTATIAMLLPVTFTLPPVSALIMLAGITAVQQHPSWLMSRAKLLRSLRHWTVIRWRSKAVPVWP
jgi:TctA family transporter